MANIQKKAENRPEKKARRFHPVKYFKEVVGELKKLTWPTRKELVSHTGTVFVFIIAIAIAIGVLDLIFSQGVALMASIGS